MSVETDLYDALVADSAVGAVIADRIYPVVMPDNVTYPALAYSVISTTPIGSNGCYRTRIQVDGYATSYATIKSLRDAVLALANGRNDYTPQINADLWEDDLDLYHQPIDILIVH